MTEIIRKAFNKVFSGRDSARRFVSGMDPNKPEERKEIISKAVDKTVKQYGKALEKLGSE